MSMRARLAAAKERAKAPAPPPDRAGHRKSVVAVAPYLRFAAVNSGRRLFGPAVDEGPLDALFRCVEAVFDDVMSAIPSLRARHLPGTMSM